MKKFLLGSTAMAATLVAGAALAEEPIKLSLGGYYRAVGIHQNSDLPNLRSAYIGQEGRISIQGATTLDNGITAGVYTQLRYAEPMQNNGDPDGLFRRAYAFFEGTGGRIELGNADGAALQMGYTSPDPMPGSGVNSPNFYPNAPQIAGNVGNIAGSLGSTPTTYQNWDRQNTKLSYFTPRVMGFQFGVSFTPESCKHVPGATPSCPAHGNAPGDANFAQTSDIWQLGLNYQRTFSDIDIGLSSTFVQGSLESNSQTIGTETVAIAKDLRDRQSYSFGLNLGYGGFVFGTSYLHDTGTGLIENNQSSIDTDVHAWDAGLKYTTGPWSAGVQYIESRRHNPLGTFRNGSGGGNDTVRAFMVGGGYALGPGIDLGIGYQVWDWSTSYRNPANRSLVSGRETTADMFLLGTVLKF